MQPYACHGTYFVQNINIKNIKIGPQSEERKHSVTVKAVTIYIECDHDISEDTKDLIENLTGIGLSGKVEVYCEAQTKMIPKDEGIHINIIKRTPINSSILNHYHQLYACMHAETTWES